MKMTERSIEEAIADAALASNALDHPKMQQILHLRQRGILDDTSTAQRIGWELVKAVDWDEVGRIMAFGAKSAKNELHKSPTTQDFESSHIQLPSETDLGILERMRRWLENR